MYRSKKLIFSSMLLILLLGTLSFTLRSNAKTSNEWREEYRLYPNNIITTPDTPAKMQEKQIRGTTTSKGNPAVYIFQNDSHKWVVDAALSPVVLDNMVSIGEDVPVQSTVPIMFDFNKDEYLPDIGYTLTDGSNRKIPHKLMIWKFITEIEATQERYGEMIDYSFPVEDSNAARVEIEFGGNSYDYRPGSYNTWVGANNIVKSSASYGPYYTLTWFGIYEEAKEIQLEVASPMKLGDTQQAKGSVRTRAPAEDSVGSRYLKWGNWFDVSDKPEATFSLVSGNAITITPKGEIKAVAKGTSTIQIDWIKDGYHLRTTADVVVDDKGGGTIPDPTPTGKCQRPTKTSSMKNAPANMIPDVTGTIRADDRDAEKFNVDLGIPTTESLFVNVLAKNWLNEYDFGKWEGNCTYEINVTKTYNLYWESCSSYTRPDGSSGETCTDESDTEVVTKTYDIRRDYSYWALDVWKAYEIEKARANNYALPNGEITLMPHGYTPPNISSSKLPDWSDHIVEPSYSDKDLGSQSLNGGRSRPSVPNEDWTSVAEGQVGQVKAKNDSLKIDSGTVMDNGLYTRSTPAPTTPKSAVQIGRDVLYEKNQVIEATKLNGHDYPSEGDITYKPYNFVDTQPQPKVYPITDYDDVTIHTPVVNYSEIPDINRPFDQSLHPDMSRIAFVLNRGQNLIFPNSGQHRNIPGYGNRDYTKYTQEKRIQFPFDIYKEGVFYKANSWITLDLTKDLTEFKIPHWITEGVYTVRTESWAINSPSRDQAITEHNANLNLDNYGAYETFDVKILGRVYGFRVYDIGDLRFESVFRKGPGSYEWTGFQYYSGSKDLDGNPSPVANEPLKQLPVRVGSHPTEKGTVSHNGYPFYFFFNTMGNVWNSNEGVKIVPKFYFVPNTGGTPVEVDLYYNSVNKKLIKVGSEQDKAEFKRTIVMADPLRNINTQYLEYAAVFEYNNFLSADAKAKTNLTKYVRQALKRKVQQAAGYKDMVLDLKSRTLVGPPDEPQVDSDVQQRAIQRWFGEYSLPVAPYAVTKGTDLESIVRTKYKGKITGKETEFKKNGYLIVNFDITTYRGNSNDGIFAYDASRAGMANMWQIESEVTQATSWKGATFKFNSGDIMMFESDFSARQDVKNKGW